MDHNTVLWTRSYILNNLVCFIINVSYYMLMVIMTDYASHQLHGTLSEAGFATGSFIIGALLARFFMGGRIERIGLKKSAYLGIFIFLAALMANFFTTTIAQLSLVRLIQGFGFGTGSTTTGAIMAHMVPSSRRGEGTSYCTCAGRLTSRYRKITGPHHHDFPGIRQRRPRNRSAYRRKLANSLLRPANHRENRRNQRIYP